MGRRKTSPENRHGPHNSGLQLTPRDRSGDFPRWSPRPPAGGWTPRHEWDAAEDYATECETTSGATFQTLARAAYHELLRSIPGLHRRDAAARLSGDAPRRHTSLPQELFTDETPEN